MTWTVRLRAHADGLLIERATYGTPEAAMDAYRVLLARPDLSGQPVAAVFKPPAGAVERGNRSTWFSRFDRALGEGRLHPHDMRLDPWTGQGEAERIAMTSPELEADPELHDWEADPRSFGACLKAWHAAHQWTRDEAAAELRASRGTYDNWCDGRSAASESSVRRLMTLIDRAGANV